MFGSVFNYRPLWILLSITIAIASICWWNYSEEKGTVNFNEPEINQHANVLQPMETNVDAYPKSEQDNSKAVQVFQKALEQSASNPVISQPNQYPDLVSALQEIQRIQLKDARVSPFAEMKKE